MQPAGGTQRGRPDGRTQETALKPWLFRCSAQDSARVRTLVWLEDPTVSRRGSCGFCGRCLMSSKNSPGKLLQQNLLPLLPTGETFVSVRLRRESRLCALQGEGGIWSGGTYLGGYPGGSPALDPWVSLGVVAYLGAGGVECVSATAQPPAGVPRVLPGL